MLVTKTEATSRTLWIGDMVITPPAETPKSTIEIDNF
jgi:hypothetical protein